MKNFAFKFLYAVTAIVVIINTVFAVKTGLFYDINDLPQGKLIYSSLSPGGTKRMNVYAVKNSLGTAVRGELQENGTAKNIYWQTGVNSAEVVWVGEGGVLINRIPLNLAKGDDFDSRRGTSLFADGALDESLLE